MKEIMKGNVALAEGAVRAGCMLYAGYPITPQTDILEYLSSRMPELGRVFIQTESEIAAINVVLGAAATGNRAMTSSSGPGFSLKQEGISYLASIELPAVIIDVMRFGIGLGRITVGQCDYYQAVKGGGHGGYMCPVYAPASVQENADIISVAFDTAEKYRTPVIVLSDASIGQMSESVCLPEFIQSNPDSFDWALGTPKKHYPFGHRRTDVSYRDYPGSEYEKHIIDKYSRIKQVEQRWEEVCMEDTDLVLVAYGITSRVCKETVQIARRDGIKLGLIRPITLRPFPTKAFEKYNEKVNGYISVEMNITGQMVEDVFLASRGITPVYSCPSGISVPDSDVILGMVKDIIAGKRGVFCP